MYCDICNLEVSEKTSTRLAAVDFRRAVNNSLSLERFPLDREKQDRQIKDSWHHLVMTDDECWVLCEGCFQVTIPFLAYSKDVEQGTADKRASWKRSLKKIRRARKTLFESLDVAEEWGDTALHLQPGDRTGDPTRHFKYLHQMCFLNVEPFRASNSIKMLYLLDGWLNMVDLKNPHGAFYMARGMLEHHALLAKVVNTLSNIQSGDMRNWKSRGNQFFQTLVRARWCTSDAQKRSSLKKAGASAKTLKPFNVMDCLRGLDADSDASAPGKRYEALCDFVHHNTSSQLIVSPELRWDNKSTGGPHAKTVIYPAATRIRSYQYPSIGSEVVGPAETADGVLVDLKRTVHWLKEIPTSPFRLEEIRERTGSDHGFRILEVLEGKSTKTTTKVARAMKMGRNSPCSCASGKKYKHCCGRMYG